MIVYREARDGELPGSADKGEFRLVVERDGEVVAYACASIVTVNDDEKQAWLHDAWTSADADEYDLLRVLSKVRTWIREQGYDHFYANVFAGTDFAKVLSKRMTAYQIIFRSTTHGD